MFFNLFKKKNKEGEPEKKDGEDGADSPASNGENSLEKEKAASGESENSSSNASIIKLNTEIDRMKASMESFQEIRKSFTERFTRTSEQIGELRAMILERDKTIQTVELKAIKSADLVESVHPEKLMTELQKEDVKLEALKANIEGNESIMNRLMDELKEIKRRIDFIKGVEEIIKLSEEMKKDLIEIKKTESKIGLEADKVETIYSEMRKKFSDNDSMVSEYQELKATQEQSLKDISFLKDKVSGMVEKEELEKIAQRVQRYVDALKELEKKSSLTKDLNTLKVMLNDLK